MRRTVLTNINSKLEKAMNNNKIIFETNMMPSKCQPDHRGTKSNSIKLLLGSLILLMNIVFVAHVHAQDGATITGKVISSSDGLPMIGVTIAEKNASNRFVNGTITDFNGNYSITVADVNNPLSFSFIGFAQIQEVPGDKRVINITMDEASVEIGEVVVSALRMESDGEFNMDPKRITTAVTTVDFKELENVQASSFADQLQGRISGVDIVANSGDPGAGMSIRIRGTSSLNASSEPLIVINGIPFETQVDNSFDFSVADEQEYAALIGVSADDIEEISVLKDAAATAQYGSRGANGVLMIKTKRGSRGKAVFSAGYRGSVSQQPDGIPMLNGHQYSTLIKDETLMLGKSRGSYPQVEFDPSYELYDYYNKDVNWLDEITQIGTVHNVNFGVSGGGEKAMYRISSSYKEEVGTTLGTANMLFTTRALMDYYVSDKLRITSELAFNHGSLDRSYPDIRNNALTKMPNQSIYELDEFGNSTGAYFTPVDAFQGSGTSYYNPVAMANLYTYNVENNRISPNFRLSYKLLKTLSYDAVLSFDANNNKTVFFVPEEAMGTSWAGSSANNAKLSDSEFFVIRTENKLTWRPNLGEDHSLFSAIKFISNDKISQTYSASSSNSPSTLLQTPIIDTRIEGSGNTISSNYTQYRQLTYNVAFNYAYKEKYILSGNINREGNSRFGKSYRYGTFPSIGARWIVSDEAFLKNINWLDEFSVRASYGVNGRSPDFNYGQYNVYSTYSYNYIDERPAFPASVELKGLKWETVTQQNLGFNLRLFDNRIDADMDIYMKRTEDLLSENTSIPSTSGFSSLPYLNIGTIDNQGWELSVMSKIIKKKDFRFDFNFNVSQNINVIREITEAMDVEEGNALETGPNGYLRRIQVDNPIGSFYGYRYLGVYSEADEYPTNTSNYIFARDENGDVIYDFNGEPKYMKFNNSRFFQSGDAMYEDINHDGNINVLDVVYLGDANPKLHGGFGPNFTYKQIQFNVFFNFRLKQQVMNLARMNTESMDGLDNQSTATLRRWRYEGNETDIPRAYYNSPFNNLGSDRYMEDASFLRMKYVTLRYNLPKNALGRIGLTTASVYITGQNLLTFTRYTGPDPETGSSDNWKNVGYDRNLTPRAKQITLGLNASF